MKDSKSLRNKRHSAAKSLQILAISGATLALCATATGIWLTHPGQSHESVNSPVVLKSAESNS